MAASSLAFPVCTLASFHAYRELLEKSSPLPTDAVVSAKHAKRADKFMLNSLTAAKKALADGGITGEVFDMLNKCRCGIIIGPALGGFKTQALEALKISCRKVHLFSVPYGIINMGSAILAIDLGCKSPNYSISSACATGNTYILNAAHHIIKGDTASSSI